VKKKVLIFTLTILVLFLAKFSFNYFSFQYKFNNPLVNDIYIFKYEEEFQPMKIDKIDNNQIYFLSHKFKYTNSIPSIKQIKLDSFNDDFHFIYDSSELKKMKNEGRIIKILRD
jgi:hypothetical protein